MSEIVAAVASLCVDACCTLGEGMESALRQACSREESPVGREVLGQLVENLSLAREARRPVCQDTGLTLVFVRFGQEVHVTGGSLTDAINEGVRRGYAEGYLRKSVLDPITRKNTGDNTPAIIHYDIVPGDALEITLAPKGAGSENMGGAAMLTPVQGMEGVKSFIVETVRLAGANPCPPIIVCAGIGGNMEKAMLVAKLQMLRAVGEPSPDPVVAELERELLARINSLGIGPMGLGGNVTALAVHIGTYPTHIAQLPVAVNIVCHAYRHKTVVL